MNLLDRIRRRADRLSRAGLTAFLAVWISLAADPCAASMVFDPPHDHDCPLCPPRSCHEREPADCEAPDSIDNLRTAEQSPLLAPPPNAAPPVPVLRITEIHRESVQRPPARAGPRRHLLYAQFNE